MIAEQGASRDVSAVIITYFPEVEALRASLAGLAEQVERILIVDNATHDAAFDAFVRDLPAGVILLRNPVNLGLGAAMNRAAQWAAEHDSGYLLLLDQDSVVRPGMVATLLDALVTLAQSAKVAAVGPTFVDRRTGQPAPFVRIGFPFNRKIHCREGDTVECDFLISSGSLIPLAALAQVGCMDESLFIDNVDLEWCFRARSQGWQLHGVGSARMEHAIGDRIVRLPLGLGEVIVHSPVRLYYMMRNRLLLYRRADTPPVWIAQDIPRLVLKLLRLALLVPPRIANLRHMLAGLRDGLGGVSGPFRGVSRGPA